jgi:hypothetical protein
MKWMRSVLSPALLLALLTGAVCLEGEAYGQKKKKKKKADPAPTKSREKEVSEKDPRLKSIRGDLEATFRHWDADKNNKVTAAELARGMRGQDAVPYRAPSPGEAKKTGMRELKLPEIAKKYPDYSFMLHWDKDRDDVLTAEEFGTYVSHVTYHYRNN